jgi:tetratricopeptide (TPR) repeat protein
MNGTGIVRRSTTVVVSLVIVTAGVVGGLRVRLAQQEPVSQAASIAIDAWPICSSMGAATEGPAWAPLDPDFAAGKRALAARDWKGAIAAFGSAALRDTRNADIQNYLGYAHRRLRQLEPAVAHYRQALALNPRHRGAREHLGEAYLVVGDLANAEAQLDSLRQICLIACDEFGHLERAIATYRNGGAGSSEWRSSL